MKPDNFPTTPENFAERREDAPDDRLCMRLVAIDARDGDEAAMRMLSHGVNVCDLCGIRFNVSEGKSGRLQVLPDVESLDTNYCSTVFPTNS